MLIRMSDRVRFCDREVVAAGALQAIIRRSPRAPKGLIAAHARVPVAWKEASFFRRDAPGAAFCALSIKPSSYVQPCRKQSPANRDWNIKEPDRNISCSGPLLISLRYYRKPWGLSRIFPD